MAASTSSGSGSGLVPGLAPTAALGPSPAAGRPEKTAIIMVGLPARGKSYITASVQAHFAARLSIKTFNVGNWRRTKRADEPGPAPSALVQDSSFFDPNNSQTASYREQLASEVLDDLLAFLLHQGGHVGIFDATNSTIKRRQWICDQIAARAGPGAVRVVFLESFCDDVDIVSENIIRKLTNDDYRHVHPVQAVLDFCSRIRQYEKKYVPLGAEIATAREHQLDPATLTCTLEPYIQIVNVGSEIKTQGIDTAAAETDRSAPFTSQLYAFLRRLFPEPRTVWLAPASPAYANALARLVAPPEIGAQSLTYGRDPCSLAPRSMSSFDFPESLRSPPSFDKLPPAAVQVTTPPETPPRISSVISLKSLVQPPQKKAKQKRADSAPRAPYLAAPTFPITPPLEGACPFQALTGAPAISAPQYEAHLISISSDELGDWVHQIASSAGSFVKHETMELDESNGDDNRDDDEDDDDLLELRPSRRRRADAGAATAASSATASPPAEIYRRLHTAFETDPSPLTIVVAPPGMVEDVRQTNFGTKRTDSSFSTDEILAIARAAAAGSADPAADARRAIEAAAATAASAPALAVPSVHEFQVFSCGPVHRAIYTLRNGRLEEFR